MNRSLFLKRKIHADNEKGAVLIVGLLVILVLTVLCMATMMSTGTELRIAANDRSAKQAFYLAEAGLEDARSRLQTSATAFPINDDQPANALWTAFIGTEVRSQAKGYQSGNTNYTRYDSLNPGNMDYVVTIRHKVDASNNIVKWGDSNIDGFPEENTTNGTNIFVIESTGYTPTGAIKPLRIEATQVPPPTVPAALYTKKDTTIQGTSTHVLGMDHCGNSHVNGVVTKALKVTENGNPEINGSPSRIETHSATNIDVQHMIDMFKQPPQVTDPYNVNSATYTGMHWGNPNPGADQQCATSCTEHHIVHFNTHNTYIKLAGGTSGCGMLLVEGDLEVEGGFQWYGLILVTGSITFTGGGGKNVTGAVLSAGETAIDMVGGDANIIYCSKAIKDQTENMPLVTLRWVELFG